MKINKYFASVVLAAAAISTVSAEEYHPYLGPDDIEDLEAVYDASTGSVKISFTTPHTGSYWADGADHVQEIPQLDKVVLTRSAYDTEGNWIPSVEVEVWENQQTNLKIKYVDSDVLPGYNYTYSVETEFNNNSGYSNDVKVNAFIKPAAIEDFVVKATDDKGNLPIKLAATVPSKDEGGNQLADGTITAIVFTRCEYDGWTTPTEVVNRVENPAQGELVTIDDTTAELNKYYQYGVYVETASGKGDMAMVEFRTGQDVPVAVDEKSLKVDNQKTKVILSWNAVVEGENGGFVDSENMKYNIYEYDFESTDFNPVVLVEEGVMGTTYTVDLTSLTRPTKKQYQIRAVTPAGQSSVAEFPIVVAGPAAALPYIEKFNTPKDNWGGTRAETYWDIVAFDGVSDPDIYYTTYGQYYQDPANDGGEVPFTGVDGDLGVSPEVREGMVGAYFDKPAINLLTSGEISIKDAQYPVLSYSLYKVPAVCESKSTLTTSVAGVDGEYKDLAVENCFTDDKTFGWQTVYVPLTGCEKEDAVTVRFTFKAGNVPSPIFVDNVAVNNYLPVVNLKAVASFEDKKVTLTWEDPSTETQVVNGYDVYADGVKVNTETLTTTTYEVALPADKETMTLRVDALYEGVVVPAEVNALWTGVESLTIENVTVKALNGSIVVKNAEGVRVRVYNVNGYKLFDGMDHNIVVAAETGVYIVDVNGNRTKVVVR